jgi:hypothetical protein
MTHIYALIGIWLIATIGVLVLFLEPYNMESFEKIKKRTTTFDIIWIVSTIITAVLVMYWVYTKGFWKI